MSWRTETHQHDEPRFWRASRRVRQILAASIVDTVGTGIFAPLSFYYFVSVTDLSIGEVGACVSLATILSFGVAPIAGNLADRWNPKNLVVLSNLVTTLGYLLYFVASSAITVFAAAFVVMAADRLYWAGWATFITKVAGPRRLDAWHSLSNAVNKGCIGVGSLVGSLILAVGSLSSLHWLILLNVAGSAASGVIMSTVQFRHRRQSGGHGGEEHSWRVVRRDRAFLTLSGSRLSLSLVRMIPDALLPVYLINYLHFSAWVPSLLFAAKCCLILFCQTSATAMVRTYRRTTVISISTALMACAIMFLAMAPEDGSMFSGGLVCASVLLFAFADMCSSPTATALAATLAPTGAVGKYMSVFQTSGAMSQGVGPGVGGLLLQWEVGALWVFLLGMTAAGSVMALTLRRRLSPVNDLPLPVN